VPFDVSNRVINGWQKAEREKSRKNGVKSIRMGEFK
jgi:hypothetical protein